MDLAKKQEDMLSFLQELEAMELESRRKRQQMPQKRQQPYSMSFSAQGQPSDPQWKMMSELKRTTLPPIQEEEDDDVDADHHHDREKRTAEIDYARLTAFLDYDDSFFSPWSWKRNPSLCDGRGRGSEFRH